MQPASDVEMNPSHSPKAQKVPGSIVGADILLNSVARSAGKIPPSPTRVSRVIAMHSKQLDDAGSVQVIPLHHVNSNLRARAPATAGLQIQGIVDNMPRRCAEMDTSAQEETF